MDWDRVEEEWHRYELPKEKWQPSDGLLTGLDADVKERKEREKNNKEFK